MVRCLTSILKRDCIIKSWLGTLVYVYLHSHFALRYFRQSFTFSLKLYQNPVKSRTYKTITCTLKEPNPLVYLDLWPSCTVCGAAWKRTSAILFTLYPENRYEPSILAIWKFQINYLTASTLALDRVKRVHKRWYRINPLTMPAWKMTNSVIIFVCEIMETNYVVLTPLTSSLARCLRTNLTLERS